MSSVSRRERLKGIAAGVTMATVSSLSPASSWAQEIHATPRKGRIKRSVSRWCYQKIPLDELCQRSAEMGLKAIDLLGVEEWEVPRRYGLICSMGYAGGGDIPNALNRMENHVKIEEAFRENIPIAAKEGVPNVITFSGNRAGMSDEDGAKNTIAGLNRVKKNRWGQRGDDLPRAAEQQGGSSRLYVRPRSVGSAGDGSGQLAAREAAL